MSYRCKTQVAKQADKHQISSQKKATVRKTNKKTRKLDV